LWLERPGVVNIEDMKPVVDYWIREFINIVPAKRFAGKKRGVLSLLQPIWQLEDLEKEQFLFKVYSHICLVPYFHHLKTLLLIYAMG
jgi:hypothetical protein